ncbi:hypothetical protein ACH5RR_001010 [Cinchona calisaya]|uniref:Essential protein Yae1 N-terminal domain-containing protein n=1 Tax=Cinchona calisaya TaxID=153742 RepID=A0ABD3B2B5_9GENT
MSELMLFSLFWPSLASREKSLPPTPLPNAPACDFLILMGLLFSPFFPPPHPRCILRLMCIFQQLFPPPKTDGKKHRCELYSDILKVSNTDPMSITDNAIHNSQDGDDLWYDDESLPDRTEKLEKASDMDREWQRRREQFHTIGYPDGLMAGKEVSAQEGFNKGFKESVFVGQTWGLVRGVTSALACLPDALKERFVETEDKRNKLQHLHESVSAMSTTDALKLFHHHCLNNRLTEQEENTQTSPQRGYLHGQCPDENILENYIQEFNSLVPEYSAIKVSRMSIKTVI